MCDKRHVHWIATSSGGLYAREQLARAAFGSRNSTIRERPGLQVSARLTELLDTVVRGSVHSLAGGRWESTIAGEMALVPNGGFGRRDVAPYSDVDLMLLVTPAAQDRAATWPTPDQEYL